MNQNATKNQNTTTAGKVMEVQNTTTADKVMEVQNMTTAGKEMEVQNMTKDSLFQRYWRCMIGGESRMREHYIGYIDTRYDLDSVFRSGMNPLLADKERKLLPGDIVFVISYDNMWKQETLLGAYVVKDNVVVNNAEDLPGYDFAWDAEWAEQLVRSTSDFVELKRIVPTNYGLTFLEDVQDSDIYTPHVVVTNDTYSSQRESFPNMEVSENQESVFTLDLFLQYVPHDETLVHINIPKANRLYYTCREWTDEDAQHLAWILRRRFNKADQMAQV